MGVTETIFRMEQGMIGTIGTGDWKVYEVRGSRMLRSAWVPFFDDGVSARIFHSTCLTSCFLSVMAIIFLAPISAFDQCLEEDPKVNLLEDSMLLWREICRNELLMNVNLILLLNKVDLLQNKLESGIQLNKYITQYKGPNSLAEVCKCEWVFVLPRTLIQRREVG
jgi:guanine nucleotide-binding protein alpha-1 subunit